MSDSKKKTNPKKVVAEKEEEAPKEKAPKKEASKPQSGREKKFAADIKAMPEKQWGLSSKDL